MRKTKIIKLKSCEVEIYDGLVMREKITWQKEISKGMKKTGEEMTMDVSSIMDANLAILPLMLVGIKEGDKKVGGDLVEYLMETEDGDKVLDEFAGMLEKK